MRRLVPAPTRARACLLVAAHLAPLGACDASAGGDPSDARAALDVTAGRDASAGLDAEPRDAPPDDATPTPTPAVDAAGPDAVVWPAPNAPVVVRTVAELLAALAAATPGTVVYVADDVSLNLTGREAIAIPARVTLASGGGVGGAGGALLYTTRLDTVPLFSARGEGVRVTGLRIRGPDTEVGASAYAQPISRGVEAIRANNLQVDHCELWGWAHTAIHLDYARRAYVHHNSIHHNRRTGLGYGVMLNHEADALIERNRFDYNRHAIAGTGRPRVSYEARYNLVGANRNGHAYDMHGENEAADNGSPYAGDRMDIHHNTFLGTEQGIVIRGRPATGAWVDDNCFGQSQAAGTAVIQRFFYGNLFVGPNAYGVAAGRCHEGSAPGRAVRSDVNGDGLADLVTLSRGSAHTFLGAQGGTFTAMPPVFRGTMDSALTDGEGHLVVDVADVNGDGRADLVTAHSSGTVYVYPGSLLGHFGGSVASFAGTYAVAAAGREGFEPIAVADVNGDGFGDLVSHRGGSVYVHRGGASGAFTGSSVTSFAGTFRSGPLHGTGHFAVDVADVTGDGRADLVSVTDTGSAYVYPGQATGAFGSGVESFDGTAALALLDGSGFEPVGLGDVNGDGRADLVMAHTNGTVYVYAGATTGRFTSRAESFAGTLASSLFSGSGHEVVAALDVTGDGRADLVTLHSSGRAYVYEGTASGTFAASHVSFDGALRSIRSGVDGHEALSEKSVLRRRGCRATGCL